MKKILAFGLILVLSALTLSVALSKSVPIYQDVGYCYVVPMDQISIPTYITENNTLITCSDFQIQSFVLSDVEKSDYIMINDSQNFDKGYNDSRPGLNDLMVINSQTNQLRDLGGLDAGEVYSQGRAMPRHT